MRTLIALLSLTTAASAGEMFCADHMPWCIEIGERVSFHRLNEQIDCTEDGGAVTCDDGFVGTIDVKGDTLTVTSGTPGQWGSPQVLERIQ